MYTSKSLDSMSLSKGGRLKVRLKPNRSPMDWARLKNSMAPRPLRAVAMEEVALHHTVEDAWIVIKNKVYDITPYMEYHPGGIDILKPFLGKDGTRPFMKYHQWVNEDALLDKLAVGYLSMQ